MRQLFRVVLTPEAKQDLQTIYFYLRLRAPAAAKESCSMPPGARRRLL